MINKLILLLAVFWAAEGTCPPNRPQVECFIDPCETASCPNFPTAKCEANYCGGCNANFYLENNDITSMCNFVEPCPNGEPQVKCFADPCDIATCPNYPDALCIADYCGGCNARFYTSVGEITTRCN